MNIKIEIVSVPFEGYTNYDGLNRYDTVRYGCLQKRYFSYNNTIHSQIWPICFMNDQEHVVLYQNDMFTSHTSAYPKSINSALTSFLCGFSKYKFTATVPATGEVYQWYFDYTDSKYGKFNYLPDDSNYISRWIFRYNDNNPLNQKMELWKKLKNDGDTSVYYESFTTSDIPEYKIWELTTRNTNYYRTTPFEQKFFIRGTPFPLSKGVVMDTLRKVNLITNAILDTILPFISERINSNINTDPYYYDYFPNEKGNITVTPGIIFTCDTLWGTRFEIDSNLIIGNNKKFIIVNYDTLYCNPNSKITLLNNAILSAQYMGIPENENTPINYYGTIILDNSNVIGNDNSAIIIPYNSEINIFGDVELNNVKLEIESNGILNIKDNSILKLTGNLSNLILNLNATVNLGVNSLIKIENGANANINNIVLNLPNNYWQGIILENAGGQTTIQNCTFNNAILPVKIINDEHHAQYSKVITG
ncbi:MAG: hypothetical protein FJ216_09550, partial [Ignavibacteria bacterium]|nr:hypothetical protein [Ignavibacteria bacterium]